MALNRQTALVAAAVVALGAAGGYMLMHKSGAASPTVTPPAVPTAAAPAKHAPVHPATQHSGPRTRPAAMQAALQIFPTLPAELPGWQVSGKASFESNASSDPVSRQIDRCFNGAGSKGIAVDSPSASQTTTAPTEMNVQATLTFMRSAKAAARDLAAIRKPAALRCVSASVLDRTVALGPGATLRFSSMKRLNVPRQMFGLEFNGRVESNVLGAQSVRVVLLGTVHRATEVLVASSGFDVALPLSTDRRLLTALTARTAQVLH